MAIVFSCFSCTNCFAKKDFKIYSEKTLTGYAIYADNYDLSPISVQVNFILTNLKIEKESQQVYILKSKATKQFLTNLIVAKRGKPYKYSFNTSFSYGDVSIKSYDKHYKYALPFPKGKTYKVGQGYNGSFSHKNLNALDFPMPIGSEIAAMRDGMVVKVVEKNDKGCAEDECRKSNNYIVIQHSDGTYATYSHIMQNGSIVEEKEKVYKGQMIGYSGNVGFTSGPHLHVTVYKPRIPMRETLRVKFLVGDGEKAEILTEGKRYTKGY